MAESARNGSGESHEVFREGGRSSVVILILLCLTYAFDYTDRMIVASLLPFIKQDWGLSDQLLGSLSGIVSLFIALFVIPFSLIVDRWSRRKMVAIMVFFWSIATIACAFARNYEELLLARAFTGVGEAGYAPAAIAIIAASFPRERRAIAVGIWDAFAPIGAGLGFRSAGMWDFTTAGSTPSGWSAFRGSSSPFFSGLPGTIVPFRSRPSPPTRRVQRERCGLQSSSCLPYQHCGLSTLPSR